MISIRSHATAVALLTGLLVAKVAAVGPVTWQLSPPAEGGWSDGVNWSGGIPASDSIAVIDNGGTSTIAANAQAFDLVLGSQSGTSGHLRQSNGDFIVYNDIFVGQHGSASYDFSGGRFLSGEVLVGSFPGSTGELEISGGFFRPSYLFLGRRSGPDATGGKAFVVQTGGEVEVFYASMMLSGEEARYELHGGSLKARELTIWGETGPSRFVQTGGLNDAHSNSGGGYGTGVLRVGVRGNDTGYYELHGGDLLTEWTYVGAPLGHGMFSQTGGNHRAYQDLLLASEGTYEISGGTLRVDKVLRVGVEGPAELSIGGAGATIFTRELEVRSTGTVAFGIGAAGVTLVRLAQPASFLGTLRVTDEGAPAGEYPLIQAVAITQFHPQAIELPGPNWSVRLEGGTLTATKVPEPAAISIISCVCLALAAARRRTARCTK